MIIRQSHEDRKRSVEDRLENAVRFNAAGEPVFTATNIQYEESEKTRAESEKTRAIDAGGIGVIHKLPLDSDLVDALNRPPYGCD